MQNMSFNCLSQRMTNLLQHLHDASLKTSERARTHRRSVYWMHCDLSILDVTLRKAACTETANVLSVVESGSGCWIHWRWGCRELVSSQMPWLAHSESANHLGRIVQRLGANFHSSEPRQLNSRIAATGSQGK